MRPPRVDVQSVDLAGFEAWLRTQLVGPAFAAVIVVVLQMIRALFEQNTQLRMRLAGRRPTPPPSERMRALERQLAFAFFVPSNEVASSTPSPAETASSPATPDPPRRRPPNRRGPLTPGLPVVETFNDVPTERRLCQRCGVNMATVSRRKVTTIEMIVAKIFEHRRYDETVACPCCDAIVSAKAPASVMDGGLLGTTLVTEALCNKVLDGTPIERQARNLQRQGAPVAASTLGRAVSTVLGLLVSLARRVHLRLKQSERVQLDATSLPVLDPSAPDGIVRDTLWVLIGDREWVYFATLESGNAEALEEVLCEAEAISYQGDGTSVTNFLENRWFRRRPGCHAHGRRRLVAAVRSGDLRALDGLKIYQKLFEIERRASRTGLDAAARQRLREIESVLVLDELRHWVLGLAPKVEPKSILAEGLTYLQRQWLRLCLFVFDGEVDLTNNRSEREIRPWALGRHTWLFVGDQEHATRWAAAYTLAHTALAHGLNPRAYLHAVVKALIHGHPHNQLDALLPDAMRSTNPELADPLAHRRQIAPAAAVAEKTTPLAA